MFKYLFKRYNTRQICYIRRVAKRICTLKLFNHSSSVFQVLQKGTNTSMKIEDIVAAHEAYIIWCSLAKEATFKLQDYVLIYLCSLKDSLKFVTIQVLDCNYKSHPLYES